MATTYTTPIEASEALYKELLRGLAVRLASTSSILKEYRRLAEFIRKEVISYTKIVKEDIGTLSELRIVLEKMQQAYHRMSGRAQEIADYHPSKFFHCMEAGWGLYGGEKSFVGFFEGLADGWKLTIRPELLNHGDAFKDDMDSPSPIQDRDQTINDIAAGISWISLYSPVQSFYQEQKGIKVKLSWVAIYTGIKNAFSDVHAFVGFQEGKRHKGLAAKSPHPHCMTGDPGIFCWGDGEKAKTLFASKWNLSAIVQLLHSILTTPSWGHEYYKLESFTSRQGGRCSECQMWFPLKTIKKGRFCSSQGCFICESCAAVLLTSKERCRGCAEEKEYSFRHNQKKTKKRERVESPSRITCTRCLARGTYRCEVERMNSSCDTVGRICPKHTRALNKCANCGRIVCYECADAFPHCRICNRPLCASHTGNIHFFSSDEIHSTIAICTSCGCSIKYKKRIANLKRLAVLLKKKSKLVKEYSNDNNCQTVRNVAEPTVVFASSLE